MHTPRTPALVSLIFSLFAFATSLPAVAAPPPAPQVVDFTLPNGLRVLLLPRPGTPSVAVQVFYHAGSKDEPEARRGIAHLFEHMMFKGSARVPPEGHGRYINELGGENNAFTTDDFTGYEETVPPAALDFTLALEADRMHGLKLTQQLLDSEREVVKEELRMRFENNPIAEGVRRLIASAFTKHPYKVMAIGTKEMLDAVTVDDCRTFYDQFYRPNNATLVIVGAATEAEVRALAAKHFEAVPRGPLITRHPVEEPPQTTPRAEAVPLQMALPVVLGAYHVPGAASADIYTLSVLREILSAGESSRLHQRVVRSGLGVFAGSELFGLEETGLFVSYAQAASAAPADIEKLRVATESEIARFTREKVSTAELKKAKNKLATSALFARTHASGLASAIGESTLMKNDPLAPFHDVEHYDAVTADQILTVAKKYLVATNRTSLTLMPRESAPPVAEAPPKKSIPPAQVPSPRDPKILPLVPPRDLPAPTMSLGEVIRDRLPNGLRLLVVPRHDLPIVSVQLTMPAGDLDAPIDRMGLAELTAGLLRKGAGKRSALQIAEAVDSAGASLSTEVQDENAALSMGARATDLPLVLSLLADMSMRPLFPSKELPETVRSLVAEQVHDLRDSPAQLAMMHAANVYYGDSDPRGRPISERSVGAVTRADIVSFHDKRYRPDGALLIVAGDVDVARLKTLLQETGGLGTWKSRGLLAETARQLPARHAMRVRLVDKPEATQTTLVLEGPGLAHASPELFAFSCANYILGGGDFSSRLMQVLRADGGKTYGVQSSFTHDREPGTFMITTTTRVQESARTLQLLTTEIAKLQKGGPTATELDSARSALVGRTALSFETAGDVARAMGRATLDGLPDDFVEKAPTRIRSITLDEAKRAAGRFVPEALVAVGPAATVRPLLEALGMKIDEVVPFDAAVAAADRK